MPSSSAPSSRSRSIADEPLPGWGHISSLLSRPPLNVEDDVWWPAVLFFYLLAPILLPLTALASASRLAYRCAALWLASATRHGRPVAAAPLSMMAALTEVFAFLITCEGNRLKYYIWEYEAFGKLEQWWHGEGPWVWRYAKVHSIVREPQWRNASFGCATAPVPDVWASRVITFLSNLEGKAGSGEWRELRGLLHRHFLAGDAVARRRAELRSRFGAELGDLARGDLEERLELLADQTVTNKLVAKGLFYVAFGVWLADADADIILGWRRHQVLFMMPRMFHRLVFNVGIKKIKRMRREQAELFDRHPQLKQLFVEINGELSQAFQRGSGVELMDELMYALGWFGITATCLGVESIGRVFNEPPGLGSINLIQFGRDMATPASRVDLYIEDKERFIRELWRLDPPITSATTVMQRDEEIAWPRLFGCIGSGARLVQPGTARQYVIGMANRDVTIFKDPKLFNPRRPELNLALTWNGCFGKHAQTEADAQMDEAAYRRICPGRYISLDVARAIIDAVLGLDEPAEP